MKSKHQVPERTEDFVREIGAPDIIYHDNAKETMSDKWLALLRKYIIDDEMCEPHHQNSNLAERRGGMMKSAFDKLFLETSADIKYW